VDISLVSTINTNYRVPFEILASSLIRAKHESTVIEWHVCTDEGCDWDTWRMEMDRRHRSQNVSFRVHDLQGTISRSLPLRGRARPIMYARLFAPELLASHAARMLYLDADMIVLHPIEELWAVDPASSPCACCQDLAIPTVSSPMAIRDYPELNLNPHNAYFNAGVLLIDVRRWKEKAVTERALAYLNTYSEAVNLFDQEALNAALGGDWHRVSYRWNLIASVAGRSFLDTTPLDSADYQASLRQPHILHYAGTLKPWLNPFLKGRWFDLYRAAAMQALPQHKFCRSLKHLAHAVYDASVRRWSYPMERALWQARRGF